MIEALAQLQALLALPLWHGAAVFLRVVAMVSVLPAFSERTVPIRVKLVLSLMFTAVTAPAVAPFLTEAPGLSRLAVLVPSETVIGLAYGIAIRLFVLALQTAGSMAAQATSLSQILGGAAVEPMPAVGYVLTLAGVALALLAGLHLQAVRLIVASYETFPPGRMPDPALISSWGIARVAESFALAFILASPFVIASVLYNLTLGVINRAMPQLMVAFVGAPVITFGALLMLFVASPALLSVWLEALGGFFADPAAMRR